MFRSLYIEVIKLKRSTMLLVSMLAVAVAPFLNYLIFLSLKSNLPSAMSVERYFEQGYIFLTALTATIIFTLIATYVFDREYQERTLENTLTIPIGRTEVIIAKMIILLGWIIFLMIFTFVLTIVLNYMGIFIELNSAILMKYLKIYILTGVLHFALTPVIIFIILVFKSYIYSVGFSIFVTITSLVITNTKYGELFPWSLPYLLAAYKGDLYYPVSYPIISIILTFILSLTLCIVYFNKEDID
ncbi:ABC transporter permease [Wukongibacter baidiensis]|uniref:ABC transporter permease n=1 Tax=Wukongibacter baidiensis TaxID=1723361 RepID=UPI003D7F6202